MEATAYKLPDDTAKAFALAPGCPGVFYSIKLRKQIDVRTLSATMAQKLIDAGSKNIVALPAVAPTADDTSNQSAPATVPAAKVKVPAMPIVADTASDT